MKKKFLLLVCIALVAGFSLDAQTGKYGHVNSGDILKAMPGVDSISIKMRDYQSEIQAIYEDMITEFRTKQDKFDKEAGTMSANVRQIREKELSDLQNRIQEFQMGVQEDMEQKQYELAKPFQDKIQDAINAVAKESNYTYIFDTQILLYYNDNADITPLVKKKLGIK
jgi:outer membrane protein